MCDADVVTARNSMWSAGSTDLFSNKEIALLIELVEALPVLYAADKKLFKGIIPREKAWKIISEKLNRTVTECEKKWRYLRDKYVKERRRLIDEAKTTGREVKSNWQHYESMEFLSTHLRLPVNGSGKSGSVQLEDDESQRLSEGSPSSNLMASPNLTELAVMKAEQDSRPAALSGWGLQTDSDKQRTTEPSEQFKPLAPPPQYSGLMNRTPATSFTHHPLWAMWSNSLAHAQAQQQIHNLTTDNKQTSEPGPPTPDLAATSEETPEPNTKKARQSNQDVNINVSLKEMTTPAEKYSEYHFCVSLAQMMENVPSAQRPDLKIKMIQMVTSTYSLKDSRSEGSLSL